MTKVPTPWGYADDATDVGEGIIFYSTPSHGGYYVPPEKNAIIPTAWRDASFNHQGRDGWYEEDCDWSLVALTFPNVFPEKARGAAANTFQAWIKPKLAA